MLSKKGHYLAEKKYSLLLQTRQTHTPLNIKFFIEAHSICLDIKNPLVPIFSAKVFHLWKNNISVFSKLLRPKTFLSSLLSASFLHKAH